MISAKAAAAALGGEARGNQVLAPGPGHSKRDRSLSVTFTPGAPEGFLVHSFAGHDPIQLRDYVRSRLRLPDRERARKVDHHPRPDMGGGRQQERPAPDLWSPIWGGALRFKGTIVEDYLVGRGITGLDDIERGDAIRFAERCPFKLTGGVLMHLPAMVCLHRDIVTSEPCGIHRTALWPDGSGKSEVPGLGDPKKMMGRAKGAAIKHCADADVTTVLGIGEGVESTLSLRSIPECFGVPVWACMSAPALAAFPVLPGVETLWVAVDHDKAGIKAAGEVRARWATAGKEVFTVQATAEKQDLNDVVREVPHG